MPKRKTEAEELLGRIEVLYREIRDEARAERAKPRRKPRKPLSRPPTEVEVTALAEAAPNPVLRALMLTCAYSGVRLTEACKLRWCDVRLHAVPDCPATVLLHVDGKRVYKHIPKPRDVVLFEPGLTAMMDLEPDVHHPKLPVFRMPAGNWAGRPYVRNGVNAAWQEWRVRAGLPKVLFKDLRKFHASWLMDQGVSDLDVAVQLGHIDRMGRPHTDLVRKTYGFPNLMPALERVARVAG